MTIADYLPGTIFVFVLLLKSIFIYLSVFFFKDFTTDFYFRQYWNDNRLRYSKATGVELLSVSTEYLRNIWVPDTFFPNEKTSYFHMATTSNEFLRIKYNGDINRSIR